MKEDLTHLLAEYVETDCMPKGGNYEYAKAHLVEELQNTYQWVTDVHAILDYLSTLDEKTFCQMVNDGDPRVIQVMVKGLCSDIPDLFGSLGGTIEMLTPGLKQDTIKQLVLLRWFKEEYMPQHPEHTEFLEKLYQHAARSHFGATWIIGKARENNFSADWLIQESRKYAFEELR